MARLLSLAVLAFGLLLGPSATAAPRSDGCKTRCYQQKSFDYQNCRMIPPGKREARNACFIRADSALQRCLRGC